MLRAPAFVPSVERLLRRPIVPVLAMVVAASAACSVSSDPSSTEDGALATASDGDDFTTNADGVVLLNQGWSAEDRRDWERTPDGSGVIPYPWLMALEQETSTDMFLADAEKYGLLPLTTDDPNPLKLPTGLAKQTNGAMVGSTCSACHEAQVTYRGTKIRVLGGQGRALFGAYLTRAYQALGVTLQSLATADPSKFDRFAERVLGMMGAPAGDPTAKQQLVAQIKGVLASFKPRAEAEAAMGIVYAPTGPYRQDATGAGTNNVVSKVGYQNLRSVDAPVSTPFLWGTPSFTWVEYNNNAGQPMARNIISTLARGASLSFDPADRFANPIELDNLAKLERLASKLRAPKWPSRILGGLDGDKVAAGARIYGAECASCHEAHQDAAGHLDNGIVALAEIGTDPKMAENWAGRTVDMGSFPGPEGNPLGTISIVEFSRLVTQGVEDRNYAAMGVSEAQRNEMNGRATNEWQAVRGYRARPLNGIWATGPYLHNGSVPTLYDLLLPEDQRPRKFHTGSAELDVDKVGLRSDEGEFELDTSLPGNRNTGHRYGTELDETSRRALVEYLKSL